MFQFVINENKKFAGIFDCETNTAYVDDSSPEILLLSIKKKNYISLPQDAKVVKTEKAGLFLYDDNPASFSFSALPFSFEKKISLLSFLRENGFNGGSDKVVVWDNYDHFIDYFRLFKNENFIFYGNGKYSWDTFSLDKDKKTVESFFNFYNEEILDFLEENSYKADGGRYVYWKTFDTNNITDLWCQTYIFIAKKSDFSNSELYSFIDDVMSKCWAGPWDKNVSVISDDISVSFGNNYVNVSKFNNSVPVSLPDKYKEVRVYDIIKLPAGLRKVPVVVNFYWDENFDKFTSGYFDKMRGEEFTNYVAKFTYWDDRYLTFCKYTTTDGDVYYAPDNSEWFDFFKIYNAEFHFEVKNENGELVLYMHDPDIPADDWEYYKNEIIERLNYPNCHRSGITKEELFSKTWLGWILPYDEAKERALSEMREVFDHGIVPLVNKIRKMHERILEARFLYDGYVAPSGIRVMFRNSRITGTKYNNDYLVEYNGGFDFRDYGTLRILDYVTQERFADCDNLISNIQNDLVPYLLLNLPLPIQLTTLGYAGITDNFKINKALNLFLIDGDFQTAVDIVKKVKSKTLYSFYINIQGDISISFQNNGVLDLWAYRRLPLEIYEKFNFAFKDFKFNKARITNYTSWNKKNSFCVENGEIVEAVSNENIQSVCDIIEIVDDLLSNNNISIFSYKIENKFPKADGLFGTKNMLVNDNGTLVLRPQLQHLDEIGFMYNQFTTALNNAINQFKNNYSNSYNLIGTPDVYLIAQWYVQNGIQKFDINNIANIYYPFISAGNAGSFETPLTFEPVFDTYGVLKGVNISDAPVYVTTKTSGACSAVIRIGKDGVESGEYIGGDEFKASQILQCQCGVEFKINARTNEVTYVKYYSYSDDECNESTSEQTYAPMNIAYPKDDCGKLPQKEGYYVIVNANTTKLDETMDKVEATLKVIKKHKDGDNWKCEDITNTDTGKKILSDMKLDGLNVIPNQGA